MRALRTERRTINSRKEEVDWIKNGVGYSIKREIECEEDIERVLKGVADHEDKERKRGVDVWLSFFNFKHGIIDQCSQN